MYLSAIIILPLLGIGVGIFVLFVVGNSYLSSKNMDEWQVTQGVITKLNIKYAGTAYILDVQYQYFVLEKEYKGMRVNILPKQTYKREVAGEWIIQYPIGKKVDVFYHPQRPRVAVLEKGFSIKNSLLLLGLGLFLMVFNTLFLLIPFL
jgi:hypothetical protein